jgi:putative heme-binding domain-containing protein
MRSNDMNFIPVTQKVGPDGALYVSDWSDKQVCHRGSGAVELWDRSNGRIYKISYEGDGTSRSGGLIPPSKPNRDSGKNEASGSAANAEVASTAVLNRRSLHQAPFDLNKLSDLELAKMAVEDTNEFFVRQARRVLMERGGKRDLVNDPSTDARYSLLNFLKTQELDAFVAKNEARELRAMWARYALGVPAVEADRFYQSVNQSSVGKVWGIRLMSEEWKPEAPIFRFLNQTEIESPPKQTGTPKLSFGIAALANGALENSSPLIRRELASLLQRLPLDKRTDIALALLKHGEDANDPTIPLLIWYGIEPVVGTDAEAGMKLAAASKMDQVTGFIYRRLCTDDKGRAALLQATAGVTDAAQREKTLGMIVQNARAAGKLTLPADWSTVSAKLREGASQAVVDIVDELSALSGDAASVKRFRDILAKADAPMAARERALGVLVQARDQATARVLQVIIEEEGRTGILPVSKGATPDAAAPTAATLQSSQDGRSTSTPLRRKAIQALASLPDTETAGVLINRFKGFAPEEKVDAVTTLASTRDGGSALLQAVIAKKVAPDVLSPFVIRQLQSLQNKEIDGFLEKAVGTINKPKADLAERKAKYQKMLTPAVLKGADLAAGKVTFMASCGTCHQLLGQGANVGPDLTGSNRGNLDYLLDNVLDPNAVIGKDYQLNLFSMNDGRVMSGLVKEESDSTYRTVLPGGLESTLTKSEVKKREVAKVSLMPEGQFDAMPPEMVINLVAYLQSGAPKTVGPDAPSIKVEGAIEGEAMKILSKTGGNAKNQKMGGFKASRWSGNDHLWWTGAKVGDVLTLALPVAEKGKYALKAVFTKALDYGIFELSLDGKLLGGGPIDFYNGPAVVTSGELDFGVFDLEAGEHKLEAKVVGSNPQAAPRLMLGLDYLKLEKK